MERRAECEKIAAEVADELGEEDARPRAQLLRIVVLKGERWARETAKIARRLHDAGDVGTFLSNGARRTLGGSFFHVARARVWPDVTSGRLSRDDFFRAFTDRPRKPRAPPPKRERRPPAPRPPTPARAWGQGVRRNRPMEPEVYQVRRAAR